MQAALWKYEKQLEAYFRVLYVVPNAAVKILSDIGAIQPGPTAARDVEIVQ